MISEQKLVCFWSIPIHFWSKLSGNPNFIDKNFNYLKNINRVIFQPFHPFNCSKKGLRRNYLKCIWAPSYIVPKNARISCKTRDVLDSRSTEGEEKGVFCYPKIPSILEWISRPKYSFPDRFLTLEHYNLANEAIGFEYHPSLFVGTIWPAKRDKLVKETHQNYPLCSDRKEYNYSFVE